MNNLGEWAPGMYFALILESMWHDVTVPLVFPIKVSDSARSVDLSLEKGGDLTVRVSDGSGRPLGKTIVRVGSAALPLSIAETDSGTAHVTVATDEDGMSRFVCTWAGKYNVEATKDGVTVRQSVDVNGQNVEINLTFDR